MIGAIGYWDNAQWVDVNPYAQKKILDLWRITVKAYNVNPLILIDPRELKPVCNDEEITFETYLNLNDAISAHKDNQFVFLEVKSKIPPEIQSINLKDFNHPEGNVMYVVGSDFGDIPFKELESNPERFHFVYIETGNSIVPLWAHSALAVALYDRLAKL